MTYRDILVFAGADTTAAARHALAADLAARFGAKLIGVFVEPPFPPPLAPVEGGFAAADLVQTMLVEHRKQVARAAEDSRIAFEAAAAARGVTSDWAQVDGTTADEFLALARRSDLVVYPGRGAHPGVGLTAADVAMESGGPVLVAPEEPTDVRIGDRVLLAWNGSREAARALHDAWPILCAADKVDVVVASAKDSGPDSSLQRYFEQHGCKANIIVDRSRLDDPAAILQRHADELDADVIVMGLYGHSRLQEAVLGGVSRDMLGQRKTPILVSH